MNRDALVFVDTPRSPTPSITHGVHHELLLQPELFCYLATHLMDT